MRQNKAQVLQWIGLSEGGYVNLKEDPGGATDRGITQATYDAWNRARGRPRKPVRGISKAEAEEIIVAQYMTPVRFDDLPAGLDYAVADFAVNSGPARAVKELQRVLGFQGAAMDGIMGQKTLAAIDTADLADLIVAYCARRMAYLRGLATFKTFGKGWTSRVMGRTDGAQDGDIGVIDRAVRLARGAGDIPPPVVVAPAKANEDDTAETTWIGKAMAEPSVWIPAMGGVLSGLTEGDGPMQWALAAVIVVGAIFAATRLLKRAV